MKKNSFIEGTVIATTAVILVKILGMIYVVPFYMIVGTKGGALYSYAYNIYLIFLSISSAGIPSAISKIISEFNALGMVEAKTRAYKLGKKFIMYFSVITFVILFIFAEGIGMLILGDLAGGNTVADVALVVRCVSFAILIIPHLSVTKGFLQGHNYIKPDANANLIEQIVRILVILLGSFLVYKVFDGSLTLAVGIAVFGAFVGGLVAYGYLKISINNNKEALNLDKEYAEDKITNKEIIKKIGTYAIPFIIVSLINNIYTFTDMVLVLRTLNYLGLDAANVEFITSVISTWGGKICMIVNSIALGMTITLIPSIVEAFAMKNWQDLVHKVNKALQIIIFVSMPLTLGVSFLATPIWTIFYNTNPLGGAILKVMIFNALIGNIYLIVTIIMQSMNKFKAVYRVCIVGFICNAILDVPLMLLFNYLGLGPYYGAILASFISYSVSIYLGLRAIDQEHKINYKETGKLLLKILIPAFSMIIGLGIMNRFLVFNVYARTSSVVLILINAIVGGIIFIWLSFKLKIPQDIFGLVSLNNILKKLTFGKFQLKDN